MQKETTVSPIQEQGSDEDLKEKTPDLEIYFSGGDSRESGLSTHSIQSRSSSCDWLRSSVRRNTAQVIASNYFSNENLNP
jgi:hypothetical protein